MPSVTCPHGVRIRSGWWECGRCVRKSGLSSTEIDGLRRQSQSDEAELRRIKNRVHEKTPEEDRRDFFFQVAAVFWGGFWFSLIVGIAGCTVKAFVIRGNLFWFFPIESIIFYIGFLIWGIRDAYKLYRPYK
jgi:hypothetical protein